CLLRPWRVIRHCQQRGDEFNAAQSRSPCNAIPEKAEQAMKAIDRRLRRLQKRATVLRSAPGRNTMKRKPATAQMRSAVWRRAMIWIALLFLSVKEDTASLIKKIADSG